MSRLKQFFYLIFLVLFLGSCSEYEKLLKSSDAGLKYDRAMQYFEGEQYTKAVTLFEQILPVYRGTEKSEKLNFNHAMCYYHLKDYILASHYFQSFTRTYGNSQYQQEAEFLAAFCFYKLSPRASLDQAYTFNALDAFRLYIRRYPQSERLTECRKLINELEEKLVKKAYDGARLYYDLGQYKSAIVALRDALKEYPESRYREELMFLLLKANYLYAENSVFDKQQDRFQNTIDEYYSFIYEYPQSRFVKEAEKIFDDSRRKIGSKPEINTDITDKNGL